MYVSSSRYGTEKYFAKFFERKGLSYKIYAQKFTRKEFIVLTLTTSFLDQNGEEREVSSKSKPAPLLMSERSLFEWLRQEVTNLEYRNKQTIKNYLEEGYFE